MKYKYIVSILLFCTSTYGAWSQSIGNEIAYLITMINNQVLQIENLNKEFEFLINTYKQFDTGILKDTIDESMHSLKDTIVKEVVKMLELDSFLQDNIAIIQSDISSSLKQKSLENMRTVIHDLQIAKIAENITQPIVQQHDMYTWIQEKVEAEDSVMEQIQLLNVSLLEANKQLSQMVYETRVLQKGEALEAQLREAERVLTKEKAEAFWGIQ